MEDCLGLSEVSQLGSRLFQPGIFHLPLGCQSAQGGGGNIQQPTVPLLRLSWDLHALSKYSGLNDFRFLLGFQFGSVLKLGTCQQKPSKYCYICRNICQQIMHRWKRNPSRVDSKGLVFCMDLFHWINYVCLNQAKWELEDLEQLCPPCLL